MAKNNPDREWYYEQIKDAVLVPKLITDEARVYHLKKYPDRWTMTTVLVFTPGMIVISGDLHPGRGDARTGIICTGYDFNWFTGQLSYDYLAEKFLNRKWVPEVFQKELYNYAEQWDKDHPEDEEDGHRRQLWCVGWEEIEDATQADALRRFAEDEQCFDTAYNAIENAPSWYDKDTGNWISPFDFEFGSMGYTYDSIEVGWLSAIQRRFRETVLATEGVTA